MNIIPNIESYPEQDLKDLPLLMYFKELISKRDGVDVDDITPAWILKQREERIYPHTKFDISSKRGGYSSDGLVSLTRTDIDIIKLVAEHGNANREHWLSHLQ